jgi:tRNA 2-selenouridine synthase
VDIIEPKDFRELLVTNTPMIDVRSPSEFGKGAVPGAVNFPILNDDERAKVGACYKNEGKDAAIELGHSLISGERKEQLLSDWQSYLLDHPDAIVYCARGGLRSRISQQWIHEQGISRPIIKGGFKALRKFCLDQIEQVKDRKLIMISGMTGVGKTDVLVEQIPNIDLEGIAHHRGSSFGKTTTPQPSQIDFENKIAIEMMKIDPAVHCLIEDESRLIGRNFVPLPLQAKMKQCSIVLLQASIEERVSRIVEQYVNQPYQHYLTVYDEKVSLQLLLQQLNQGLKNLRKRLGNEAYQALHDLQVRAVAEMTTNNLTKHQQWIEQLLERYYDPMYNYQLSHKKDRIIFVGKRAEVAEYLAEKLGK